MASPEIEAFVKICRSMPTEPPEDFNAARAFAIERAKREYPVRPDVRTERVSCNGVDAIWYRPSDPTRDHVILYMHGGGFRWGSAEGHGAVISNIAAEAGFDVLAVDYDVAPFNPFPGPVDQGVAAYRWLLAQGYDPSRIALAGDSAGGGLVMSILVALKGWWNAPLPAGAAITSSWLDLTNSGESMDWVTDDPCVHLPGLELCCEIYLQGQDPSDPLASPLFADLEGLPPLLVQVGSRECLLSDSTRLATRARAAGVEAKLEVYDGCMHLWHWWVPDAPESRKAIASIAKFVRAKTRAPDK